MNDEVTKDAELSRWFSTYGFLTAERILERFNIHLKHDELIATVKNPKSYYFLLLRVPLKNIFNGIILEQARDYQIYVQKIFIDYLMSGHADKPKESPGASTREDLEAERTNLIELNESYSAHETKHYKLISESQAKLKNFAKELQGSFESSSIKIRSILSSQGIVCTKEMIQRAIRLAMIHFEGDLNEQLSTTSPVWSSFEHELNTSLNDSIKMKVSDVLQELLRSQTSIDEVLDKYLALSDQMSYDLRELRQQFFQLILRVTELIKALPDYRYDSERSAENLEALNFDTSLGEKAIR